MSTLSGLFLGQARMSLVSSAPRLRAWCVQTHWGPACSWAAAAEGRLCRDGPWGTDDRGHLPPRGEPRGHGAPGGLLAGRVTRAKRLPLEARGERGGLLHSQRAGRAMSSWTAPRNMSICTTACRSSRGGWG
ncbi:hypothetical protein NN561_001676 [Cricetulus griseus]